VIQEGSTVRFLWRGTSVCRWEWGVVLREQGTGYVIVWEPYIMASPIRWVHHSDVQLIPDHKVVAARLLGVSPLEV
jgi:hypothetical protein